MIRASQGHSVEIDLCYKSEIPPALLYHGTAESNINSIFQHGIEKRSRHHVHLSKDLETAMKVGMRHGKPVIFEIASEEMVNDGFVFYVSENGVWLTDFVPPNYILLKRIS
jgi:putative RNA 2'-phosphotransferase